MLPLDSFRLNGGKNFTRQRRQLRSRGAIFQDTPDRGCLCTGIDVSARTTTDRCKQLQIWIVDWEHHNTDEQNPSPGALTRLCSRKTRHCLTIMAFFLAISRRARQF